MTEENTFFLHTVIASSDQISEFDFKFIFKNMDMDESAFIANNL